MTPCQGVKKVSGSSCVCAHPSRESPVTDQTEERATPQVSRRDAGTSEVVCLMIRSFSVVVFSPSQWGGVKDNPVIYRTSLPKKEHVYLERGASQRRPKSQNVVTVTATARAAPQMA